MSADQISSGGTIEDLFGELLRENDLTSTWVPEAAPAGEPAQSFRREFPGVTLVLIECGVSVDLWVLDQAGNPASVFTADPANLRAASPIPYVEYVSPDVARMARTLYQHLVVRFSTGALIDVALSNLRAKGRY